MKPLILLAAAGLLIGAAPVKKLLTPNDIVAQAPASAWRTIPPDDLLVIDLKEAAQIPWVAERFFMGMNAEITFTPVMVAEDLQKGLEMAARSMAAV